MQRLTADRTDFLIAIVSINVTSRLMSYLHMNESRQMPAWHYHVQAQRCQTTERSLFLLVGIGMLKNTCGKWLLSGGRRRSPSPSMASRQPADVHATAAHEFRIPRS